MLDHVQHDRAVEISKIERKRALVEIVLVKRIQREFLAKRDRVDAGRVTPTVAQRLTQVAPGAADVQHPAARPDAIAREGVRALEIKLRPVGRSPPRRGETVELPIVKQ